MNLEHLDKNKDKGLEGYIIVYFRGRETYPKNLFSLCYKSLHCAYIIYRVKTCFFKEDMLGQIKTVLLRLRQRKYFLVSILKCLKGARKKIAFLTDAQTFF